MEKKLSKPLILAGGGLYVAFLILQLFSFLDNVGLHLVPTISILLQAAIALPVLGAAMGAVKIPLKPYVLAFGVLVGVLAIGGYLGMPKAAEEGLHRSWEMSLARDEQSIEESMGELDLLDLGIDLAGAEKDDEKDKIKEKMKKVREELSEKDKKEAERDAAVLKATKEKKSFTNRFNGYDAMSARQMNGLVLIGAFLMVVGAMFGCAKIGEEPVEPAAPAEPTA